MAVTINVLNAGNMTLGSSGPKTRFTLQGGTVEEYDIEGTLDQQWMIDHGFFSSNATWLKSITEVELAETITSVGESAFWNCNSLTHITIPSSVTKIDDYAFQYCRLSGDFLIPSSVTIIGYEAFNECQMSSLTIGNQVTSIGEQAFAGCFNLASVTITVKNEPADYEDLDKAFGVKNKLISSGVSSNITWNIPEPQS